MIEMFPFYSALAHLQDFYGIELQDDEFENMAMHAWDKIGNKRTRTYLYKVETCNGQIELPCNVDIIEAVTSNSLDYQMKDNVNREDYSANITETYIEGRKTNKPALYPHGKFLNYERVEDTLYFRNNHYGDVNILYKGLLVDDEGLPKLTVKEKEAIAVYCAYVHTMKQGMMTKDKSMLEMSMMLKAEWQRTCENARTPTYLNQNDWDTIMNAQSSWDRKRYNVSFKPIR